MILRFTRHSSSVLDKKSPIQRLLRAEKGKDIGIASSLEKDLSRNASHVDYLAKDHQDALRDVAGLDLA